MGKAPLAGRKGCEVHVSGDFYDKNCPGCQKITASYHDQRVDSANSKLFESADLGAYQQAMIIVEKENGDVIVTSYGETEGAYALLKKVRKKRLLPVQKQRKIVIDSFPDKETKNLSRFCYNANNSATPPRRRRVKTENKKESVFLQDVYFDGWAVNSHALLFWHARD